MQTTQQPLLVKLEKLAELFNSEPLTGHQQDLTQKYKEQNELLARAIQGETTITDEVTRAIRLRDNYRSDGYYDRGEQGERIRQRQNEQVSALEPLLPRTEWLTIPEESSLRFTSRHVGKSLLKPAIIVGEASLLAGSAYLYFTDPRETTTLADLAYVATIGTAALTVAIGTIGAVLTAAGVASHNIIQKTQTTKILQDAQRLDEKIKLLYSP